MKKNKINYKFNLMFNHSLNIEEFGYNNFEAVQDPKKYIIKNDFLHKVLINRQLLELSNIALLS